MAGFPDTQGAAYAFERGELYLRNGIYVMIKNVQIGQETKRGAVMGTRPFPLKMTLGSMELGDGTIEFSDSGERSRFIRDLSNIGPWREVPWDLMWILRAQGYPDIKREARGCLVKDEPVNDQSGSDALGGPIKFDFMYQLFNGKAPHSDMPHT